MSVGVHDLDSDHKLMIDEISALYSYRKSHSRQAVQELLSSLVMHVMGHCAREESHLEKIRYKKLSEHKEIHRAFIDEILSLENMLKTGQLAELSDNALNSIARWLFTHILTEDKDYAIFSARCALAMAECS